MRQELDSVSVETAAFIDLVSLTIKEWMFKESKWRTAEEFIKDEGSQAHARPLLSSRYSRISLTSRLAIS
jgi:hypothetical protein